MREDRKWMNKIKKELKTFLFLTIRENKQQKKRDNTTNKELINAKRLMMKSSLIRELNLKRNKSKLKENVKNLRRLSIPNCTKDSKKLLKSS